MGDKNPATGSGASAYSRKKSLRSFKKKIYELQELQGNVDYKLVKEYIDHPGSNQVIRSMDSSARAGLKVRK